MKFTSMLGLSAFLIFIIFAVIVAGQKTIRGLAKERAITSEAWQLCIDAGGIPIGSWRSRTVLSDCQFQEEVLLQDEKG